MLPREFFESRFCGWTDEDMADLSDQYRRKWMNDEQWECYMFLLDVFYVPANIPKQPEPWSRRGIKIDYEPCLFGNSGTHCNLLTRLVFMSHASGVCIMIKGGVDREITLIVEKCQSSIVKGLQELTEGFARAIN